MLKQGLDDWLIADGRMLVTKTLPIVYRVAEILYQGASEAQLAKEFAAEHRSLLAHSPGRDWMIWNRSYWADDGQKFRLKLVGEFAHKLRREAEKGGNRAEAGPWPVVAS